MDVSRETAARGKERAFLSLLRAAELNLVSRRDREALETRHLPESRAFARHLPPAETIVDVGSGGGLPGLVCAIWCAEAEVVLIESRARKAAWLVSAVRTLGLDNTQVVHARAEAATSVPRADVVTARAVAPLVRLLPLVRPLMADHTTLHAVKGERWADELRACGDLGRGGWDVIATPTSKADGYRSAAVDERDPHPRVVILQRRP